MSWVGTTIQLSVFTNSDAVNGSDVEGIGTPDDTVSHILQLTLYVSRYTVC